MSPLSTLPISSFGKYASGIMMIVEVAGMQRMYNNVYSLLYDFYETRGCDVADVEAARQVT